MDRRRTTLAAGLDLLSIVGFVALGRRSHDEGSAISGTLVVAAPFAIAAVLTWGATRAWRRPLAVWETGVPVWVGTVAIGLLLRNVAFDRGTALPFVIVATGMLGALMLGWRAVAGRRVATEARGLPSPT
jgi:hypothetical protein